MKNTTGHRHSWYGKQRPCGKKHRGLDAAKWTCSHWVCETCDTLDPRNFDTKPVAR